ncbi:MAG: cystathionine gamma-synthase [Pseudomonadota bacterium]
MLHQKTTAVRAGIDSDRQFNAVVPPVYLSSNFRFHDIDTPAQYDYTRSGNPTRDLLAEALAELEGGVGAVVTATGMGAITLILQLLKPDDVLVVPHDCYGGSWRLFDALARRNAFKLLTVDQSDNEALAAAFSKQPKLVWIETPSNPLLRVVDIQSLCKRARLVGALTLVDNTFLSPLGQRPLELGADLVLHSTTKYINGHSDVVGGAIVAKTEALKEELTWWANTIGITGSPFDSFLTLRGLRSLSARFALHEKNTELLVAWLHHQPEVERIHYPGLEDHPQHALASKQQSSFGAMFSMELKASRAAIGEFISRLHCFSLAESLGGVESLIALPATMTHAAMTKQAREEAGIKDNLVRISVGIEHAQDLIDDFRQAWPALRQTHPITV